MTDNNHHNVVTNNDNRLNRYSNNTRRYQQRNHDSRYYRNVHNSSSSHKQYNNINKRNYNNNNNTNNNTLPLHSAIKVRVKNAYDMQRFIDIAVHHFNNNNNKTETVQLIGCDDSITRLNHIITTDISLTSTSHHNISFISCIVPMLKLFLEYDFRYSTAVIQLKNIYGLLYRHTTFLNSLVETVQKYIDRLSCNNNVNNDTMPTAHNVLQIMFELLHCILLNVDAAQADDKLYNIYTQCCNLYQSNNVNKSHKLDILCRTVRSCILPRHHHQQQQHGSISSDVGLSSVNETMLRSYIITDDVLPGDLRTDGPRHNNDHADYRQIAIVPTHQEIMCTIQPYLPTLQNNVYNINKNVQYNRIDEYLDVLFRLLREDTIESIKQSITSIVNTPQQFVQHINNNKSNYYRTCINNSTLSDDVVAYNNNANNHSSSRSVIDLLVLRNVTINGLKTSNKGTVISVSFDQPVNHAYKKPKDIHDYWDNGYGSRLVQVGSLVVLWLNINDYIQRTNNNQTDSNDKMRLYLATVSSRPILSNVDSNDKKIHINLLSLKEHDNIDLIKYIGNKKSKKKTTTRTYIITS